MKREKLWLFLIILTAVLTLILNFYRYDQKKKAPSEALAAEAAQAYADAIDYQYSRPEAIYKLMASDYQSAISESDFVAAFEKERSYPYLTPLFINFDRVELSEDQMTGTAFYSQAARLPGMVYAVALVYENGTYGIRDFEDFLDGSYLDKFDTVTYDLNSYFSVDVQKTPESGQPID